MVKKIKKANCIYIERKFGKRNQFEIEEEEIAGKYIVKIVQMVKQRTKIEKESKINKKAVKRNAREDEKLLKVVKRYADRETLILGNEKLIQHLNIPNIAFEMRKREMKYYINEIMRYFQPVKTGYLQRRRFLLVIDSLYWNYTEVQNVIWHAKNYYEDIYVCAQETMGKALSDFFCEEYGIMIQVITKETAKNMEMNTVWLLLKRWEEFDWDYSFENGYVVAEWEDSMKRKRHKILDVKECDKEEKGTTMVKKLYSGFTYEIKKKHLPYEFAVMIAMEQICQSDGKMEENPISIVAIYSVE